VAGRQTAKFDRVVAAVESDPIVASRVFVDGAGNPVGDESSRRYWISQSTWTFVGAYFRHATKLDFDSARFEPLFGLLCEQADRNDVAVSGVSPLLNVDSDRTWRRKPDHLTVRTTVEALGWTINAYNLSLAVLLLTGAALGDRFGAASSAVGRRRGISPSVNGPSSGFPPGQGLLE
jgi:hypothetical protein